MHKLKINESSYRFIIAGGLVSAAMLLAALALPVSPARAAGSAANGPYQPAIAQLYQLQASFHRAASVHSLTGDTQDVINQRIQDMLGLWTDDGVLLLDVPGNPHDGYYISKGDLFSNCPEDSTFSQVLDLLRSYKQQVRQS